MKRGEIWLVNFDPAVGTEYKKARPALIVQSDIVSSSLVTIIPLSSQIQNRYEDDILVLKNLDNRLFSDSLIKVTQISSFDRVRFVNYIGILQDEIIEKVNTYLKKHFNLG